MKVFLYIRVATSLAEGGRGFRACGRGGAVC